MLMEVADFIEALRIDYDSYAVFLSQWGPARSRARPE